MLQGTAEKPSPVHFDHPAIGLDDRNAQAKVKNSLASSRVL